MFTPPCTLLLQVDVLAFYPALLQHCLSELQHLQQAALQGLPWPAAVVTFRWAGWQVLAAAAEHVECDKCTQLLLCFLLSFG